MPDFGERRDAREAARGQNPVATPLRSVRVLILDEDRVEGGMLAFHLRREGLVVMLMTSVEEASDAIAWSAPDAVLVEVTGRGFDGHAFLEHLATLPIDVFAVADRPLELEDELEVLRLGVIDVLMKPLDPVTLSRRLVHRPVRERRGSVADLPEGGISGDIVVHSATHILQLAHRHRMNARFHVEIDGDWAVLLVRHGEIIDAEAPSATGREAAYQVIRVETGAFVLFPLASDAEELSRDDVVRADLATLVGEALGRQEPRAVNAARATQQETFVLPHVGSPRGPLAKRGSDETLEYVAQATEVPKLNTARVKRPGEKARDARESAAPGRGATTPIGTDTFNAAAPNARSPQRPVLVPRSATGDPTAAMTVVPGDAMRNALDASRSRAGRATIDDGFDENTDQGAAREGLGSEAARGRFKNGDVEGRRPGTDPMGRILEVQDEGGERDQDRVHRSRDTIIQTPRSRQLRRVGGPRTGESSRANRQKTDPELKAIRDDQVERNLEPPAATARPPKAAEPPRVKLARPWARARPAAGPLTWVLALVLVVLAVFVTYRVVTRDDRPLVPDDHETRLGRALLDYDAGRRDAARSELAALVAATEAPSGAIAMLARIHYEDGRLPEAQALLERLSDRHPREAEVLTWLGLVQLERDDISKARESFERAHKVVPSGALARQLDALLRDGAADPGESQPNSGQRPPP